MCAKLLQSCLTLCNPMDCSLPGVFVHGILQAIILEWVAISFSRQTCTYYLFLGRLLAGASQVALVVKNSPANAGDLRDVDLTPSQEDPLEESMATHSSILAWRIPWREEPCRLQSIGLQRVKQDWSDWARTHILFAASACWEMNFKRCRKGNSELR